ncbi:MAG: GH92 family glycosyl hydrolase [Chitinophagaceae bacterium]
MKKTYSLILFGCLIFIINPVAAQDYVSFVNPYIGTAPSQVGNSLKHSIVPSESSANTIPAVTMPFSMTQWTPQSRKGETKCIAPYYYNDSLFNGIRASHWLSGSCTQDYGSLTLLPFIGALTDNITAYSYHISHADEEVGPSSYKIRLRKSLLTEVTSTLRCGMFKINNGKDDTLSILITANTNRRCIDSTDNQSIYIGSPVSRIYQGWGQPAGFNGNYCIQIIVNETAIDVASLSYKEIKENNFIIRIPIKKNDNIYIKVGSSFSNFQGAKLNLDTEIGENSFDEIKRRNIQKWNTLLGKIDIESNDDTQKHIFYSAMYHVFQQPRLYNDVDGTYPLFSKQYQLGKVAAGNYYDDFSMWDTYRAQLPLIQLLDTSLTRDFVNSILLKAKEGGWLPIFPCWNNYTNAMIGDHCIAYISFAIMNGIQGINTEEAYHIMRKNAFERPQKLSDYIQGKGRRSLDSYMKYGYIPLEDSVPFSFHSNEQVSRTLEYAFDDYCLSLVAKKLGHLTDHGKLKERSKNYKHVFDPRLKMVNGRYSDGTWFAPLKPDSRIYFITEGTPRQYSFYVPHNIPDLVQLMGGKDAFENALDSLFALNQYWHGNEPSHHIAFLYNYSKHPEKTRKTVHMILNNEYGNCPGGLSGNDDSGQLSAWYIWACIGMYPVNPMDNNYVRLTPYFKNVTLTKASGQKIVIKQ